LEAAMGSCLIQQKTARFRITMSRYRPPRYAFTLVELLVVIGIIALILAILLPSLNRAREQAKSTVCKSNLHGLARAGLTYAADNEDFIVTQLWSSTLKPYFDKESEISFNNNTKLVQCPATVGDPRFNVGVTTTPNWYGINSPMHIGDKNSAVEAPHDTAFFGDAGWKSTPTQYGFNQPLFLYYPSYGIPPVIPAYNYYNFHGRHLGKGNVAWYDGHVSEEVPLQPLNAPAYAAMKAGNSGFLAPFPRDTDWATFTSDYRHNYFFFYRKADQALFY
jgi:prepilin-type processing-associated H-X9-DG protein/prepilin-type N-terminal cleavage/methylation domain-containing protein